MDIIRNFTNSKHLNFWLSVNLCARGGAYDNFPEVAIISLLHLTTPVQKHAWQKLRQDSSTQKFYIINVVSILLIEIDLLLYTKILHV
jgi:hypothetical protein